MKNNVAFNTCIVIPCYNEQDGIKMDEYSNFLNKNQDVFICFVNDGSSDDTIPVLETLQKKHDSQIQILLLEKNSGKAEAVRAGIQHCNQNFLHQHIGYLDADLATTLEEFMTLQKYLDDTIWFCFGSRILKIGSTIVREKRRFWIGRIVATFISLVLQLKVYDTQCGCKIFTKELSELLFEKEFTSKWLFDVELFYRMIMLYGKEEAVHKMAEIPLKLWVEKGNSKVKATYFFKLWYDLYQIKKRYKISTSQNIGQHYSDAYNNPQITIANE